MAQTIVSGLAALIAGGGLFGVFYQLRQARLNTGLSRQNLDAAHRAWIVLGESPTGLIDQGDWPSRFTIEVRNIGNSPAEFLLEASMGNAFTDRLPEAPASILAQDTDLNMIAPKQSMSIEVQCEWENRRVPPPRLYVVLKYRDVLSEQVRMTRCMFWMGGSVTGAGVTSLNYDRGGIAPAVGRLEKQALS